MTWLATGAAATGVIGGAIGGLDSSRATQEGYNTTGNGILQGVGTAEGYNDKAQNQLSPWQQQGLDAGSTMQKNVNTAAGGIGTGVNTLSGIATGATPVNISQFYDPSMAFTANQAQQAMQRSAAARGGVINGGAMKDISAQISGLASQNFNNAAGMALNEQGQQISAANSLEGNGINANGQLGTLVNAGASAANNAANLNVNTGQFAGSGQASAGAAYGSGQAAAGAGTGSLISGIAGGISSIFSDATVKKNVRDLSGKDIDDTLDGLQAKSFDYKKVAKDKGAPEGKVMGIMAQDMQKTPAKSLVSEDEDGILKLDGPKTISFLLAAAARMNERLNEAGV